MAVSSDRFEAFYQSKLRGQAITPTFKLVSPDGTGGSMETIIRNPQNQKFPLDVPVFRNVKIGRKAIGDVNRSEPVKHLNVGNYEHKGSYNYSEAVDAGYAAHVKRDVQPHTRSERWWKGEVYLEPANPFSALSVRLFPVVDQKRRRIAEQLRSLDKETVVNPMDGRGAIWKGTMQ